MDIATSFNTDNLTKLSIHKAVPVLPLAQWFSVFLMLPPFNIVLYAVGIENHKLIFIAIL